MLRTASVAWSRSGVGNSCARAARIRSSSAISSATVEDLRKIRPPHDHQRREIGCRPLEHHQGFLPPQPGLPPGFAHPPDGTRALARSHLGVESLHQQIAGIAAWALAAGDRDPLRADAPPDAALILLEPAACDRHLEPSVPSGKERPCGQVQLLTLLAVAVIPRQVGTVTAAPAGGALRADLVELMAPGARSADHRWPPIPRQARRGLRVRARHPHRPRGRGGRAHRAGPVGTCSSRRTPGS